MPPLSHAAYFPLILMLSAGGAQARPALSPYLGGAIGMSGGGRLGTVGNDVLLGPFAVREKVKPGLLGSAVLGAHVQGTPISVEAEGLYVRNDVATPDLDAAFGEPLSMKTRTRAALVNLKLSTPAAHPLGPLPLRAFLAAGVGYGDSAVTILGDDYKGRGGLWQGKLGVELQASERLTVDLGYRYLQLPSFHTNQLGLEADLKTHLQAFSIGVSWAMGGR